MSVAPLSILFREAAFTISLQSTRKVSICCFLAFTGNLFRLRAMATTVEQRRNQNAVQQQDDEEIQHGPFPVEQLQVTVSPEPITSSRCIRFVGSCANWNGFGLISLKISAFLFVLTVVDLSENWDLSEETHLGFLLDSDKVDTFLECFVLLVIVLWLYTVWITRQQV